MGVIVRTAGANKTKNEIEKDFQNTLKTWEQIKEIDKYEFTMIGHHSHSHDYLIDESQNQFLNDIKTADQIFQNELGYIPKIFSYPFGEYSKFMKDYVSQKFEIAFGQHSGIIVVLASSLK